MDRETVMGSDLDGSDALGARHDYSGLEDR